MWNLKIKRELKFVKIKQNYKVEDGGNRYSCSCITDSAVISFAIAAAARHNADLLSYACEPHNTVDYGCLTFLCTRENFISITNEFLEQFHNDISYCQF